MSKINQTIIEGKVFEIKADGEQTKVLLQVGVDTYVSLLFYFKPPSELRYGKEARVIGPLKGAGSELVVVVEHLELLDHNKEQA